MKRSSPEMAAFNYRPTPAERGFPGATLDLRQYFPESQQHATKALFWFVNLSTEAPLIFCLCGKYSKIEIRKAFSG
jgi:hypothetical protein